MFKICTLASSSKGNCSFVSDGKTNILVDCGIKVTKLEESLKVIGVKLSDIDAIVITHEHVDHIAGLKSLLKKHKPKIYCHEFIQNQINERLALKIDYENVIMDGFYIGDIFVVPFKISHDAIYPLAYTFSKENRRVSVCTDLGIVTDEVRDNLMNSDMAIIEANHDRTMLLQGVYPVLLKRRVQGEFGHLSNDAAARLILDLCEHKLTKIILAHLSENNNLPELAYSTVESYLGKDENINYKDIELIVAPAEKPCKILEVI